MDASFLYDNVSVLSAVKNAHYESLKCTTSMSDLECGEYVTRKQKNNFCFHIV